MRIVTINVPDSYLNAFQILIEKGFYNSRSQIVRESIKDMLDKEKQFVEDLQPKNFEKIKALEH